MTWASRIPTIQAKLHIDDAQLGTALLASPVGLMLTMPFTKWLLTKRDSRSVMLAGTLFLCVIITLIGFASQYWQLIVLMLFFGSARNLMTISINTQGIAVQGLYPKSIMASFHGIWSIACLTGVGIGVLMVYLNIGTAYHFSIASLILALISLYFIRDTVLQKPDVRAEAPAETKWWQRAYVLPDKFLLTYALICFACMACENTMYDWSAIYFLKTINPSKTLAEWALYVFTGAVAGSRFLGDNIVNRIGIKSVLKYSGILISIGFVLVVSLPYIPSVALGFILIGAGVSCVVPMVFSLAGKSKHMSSSSALAAISTVGYMGFIIIPPFVGYVGKAASLRLSFAIVTFFGLLIVYLVSKIKEDAKEENTGIPNFLDEL